MSRKGLIRRKTNQPTIFSQTNFTEFPNRTDFRRTTCANAQGITKPTCVCGKECKNERGLKIHQTRMKCLVQISQMQRTGNVPGETQEVPGPETHHRAQSLHAPDPMNPNKSKKIKWPAASAKETWLEFDQDVCMSLEATSSGNADRRLKAMTTIIINYASGRFGCTEENENKIKRNNRRTEKIKELRQELKILRKQFRKASDEERHALAELRDIVRKKLISTKKVEGLRKRRKERARKRTAFIANPFEFARKLLGEKRTGQLKCSRSTVNSFLHDTLSDPDREKDLGVNDSVFTSELPAVNFDMREPSLKEIQDVVQAVRSASALGPSGVSYTVYKRCPGLTRKLWVIIKTIWRRGKIAEQWRFAEGVWIPKEKNSKEIEHFRTISLLCTEGKIFFKMFISAAGKLLIKKQIYWHFSA